MATIGQQLPKGYYKDAYGNIKKASGIGADYNPQASIDYLNKIRGETPVVSNTPTAPQEQSTFSGLQNSFNKGLSGLQNQYNKYTGNNYVMDDGNMTGGLGNYATYNGVGLSKEAYDAIQNPYVSEGMTAGPALEGLSVNQPFSVSGMLQNKDLMTGLAAGASAVGTGFDIYDKMWGNSAKTAKAQQNLLNQQARQNDQRMQDYKSFRQGLASSGLSGAYNG